MIKLKKVGVILLVIMVLVGLFANYIVKAIFYELIENVNEDQNYPFHISYEKTRFNVYFGNVVIRNLEIEPKPSFTAFHGKVNIDKLSISNLHLLEILNNKFMAAEIEINRPQIQIFKHEDSLHEAPKVEQTQEIGTLFSWKKLSIKNGVIKINDIENEKNIFSLNGIHVEFGSKKLSTLNDFFGSGVFETKSISFNVFRQDRLRASRAVIDLNKKNIKFYDILFRNWLDKEPYFKSTKKGNLWKMVKTDSLILKGFEKIAQDSLRIGSVEVHGLDAYLEQYHYLNKDLKDTIPINFEMPKGLKVNKFNLWDAHFTYKFKRFKNEQFKVLNIDRIELCMNEPSLNYLFYQQEAEKVTNLEDCYFTINGIYYNMSDEFDIKVEKFETNITQQSVKLCDFHLINKRDPVNFIRRQSFHHDWKDVQLDSVYMQANILEVIKNGHWESDFTHIYGMNFLLKEPGDIKKKPNKKAELMHDWFRVLPFDHDLRNICLFNSTLDYTLYFKQAEKKGTLYFTEMNGCLDRITNLDKSVVTKLTFMGKTYGKYPVELNTSLPIYNRNYAYHLEGKAGEMPLKELNVLLDPMGIHFSSGYMHKLEFVYDSEGIYSRAIGETEFNFENLQITLLEVERREIKRIDGSVRPAKIKKNKVFAWAVKKVVKENNMPGQPYYVKGKINRKRFLYQSFFGQMIQCMLQGSEYCVTHKKHPKNR